MDTANKKIGEKKSVKHIVEKSIKYNVSIVKKSIDFFSQCLLSTMPQRKGTTYFF